MIRQSNSIHFEKQFKENKDIIKINCRKLTLLQMPNSSKEIGIRINEKNLVTTYSMKLLDNYSPKNSEWD